MFRLILTSIICFVLCSCKTQEKEFQNMLILRMKIIIQQDDLLELYYTDNDSNKFISKNRISKKVIGSDLTQEVLFVLDDDKYPNRLRIDLGGNREQDGFEIKELKLCYNEAFKIFSKDEISKYFKPNQFLNFDFKSLKGKGISINQKYDPYLESMNLSSFINELILY